jgi:RNase H-fold protein (predicted Holliday junction resolvase)
VQARRSLAASEKHGKKARALIDEASAVTILQAWLDARALQERAQRDGRGRGER